MARNKYQCMKTSDVVTDKDGNPFPDLATFVINEFQPSAKPTTIALSQRNTERFFDLIYEFYTAFDYYDDIILWLNDILNISDSQNTFQKEVKMFSKIDIDNFYLSSVKGEIVRDEQRSKK